MLWAKSKGINGRCFPSEFVFLLDGARERDLSQFSAGFSRTLWFSSGTGPWLQARPASYGTGAHICLHGSLAIHKFYWAANTISAFAFCFVLCFHFRLDLSYSEDIASPIKKVLCRSYYVQVKKPFRISNLPHCRQWISQWYFLLQFYGYMPNNWACQEWKFPEKWSIT